MQASLKKIEGYLHQQLQDKRKETKPKNEKGDSVRTADLRQTFSKCDTNNWSDKLSEITEVFNDSIPSYPIENTPERYKKTLLKITEMTMKEKDGVMKKVNIT